MAGWSGAKAADARVLAQQLLEQAGQARSLGMRIVPYVLDITRPT